MARSTTTTKKGTNPFVAIMIFVVAIALIAVLLFTLKVVYPEALTGLLGSPDARLQAQSYPHWNFINNVLSCEGIVTKTCKR